MPRSTKSDQHALAKGGPSRRDFLKASAVIGAGYFIAPSPAWSASRLANGQLNVASIGVGGKGNSDSGQAGKHAKMVALCDIDDHELDSKASSFPDAKKYNDFREMLAQMGDKIDAVTVSTPDHTHAPASLMAMRMGKHVYCQKPLTHTVAEARMMREVAAEKKVATQMGNQGTAEDGLRRAVEIIQDGVIGPVREVHVWTNRPIWPQAPEVMSRPTDTPPVPKHIHWDLFLGVAPERPYALYPPNEKGEKKCAYHPFNWRGWWDFGTGALGDMACHTANMAFMALKLGYPISAEGHCGDLNPETCPSWASVVLEYPARGSMPPVKLYWYEGRKDGRKNLPPTEKLQGHRPPGSGSLLVGDKGTLYSPDDYGAQYVLLPEKDFEGYKGPQPTLPRRDPKKDDEKRVSTDEWMKIEWLRAAAGGPPAMSNFNYAGLLAESVLLGNVAMRVGKKFAWDAANLKAIGCPEADQYIHSEYRKNFTL
jgi:predicted dehydrogenase